MLLGVDKNSQECFYEADSYFSMMLNEALPEYKMDIWDVQRLRVQAVGSGIQFLSWCTRFVTQSFFSILEWFV